MALQLKLLLRDRVIGPVNMCHKRNDSECTEFQSICIKRFFYSTFSTIKNKYFSFQSVCKARREIA